MLAAVSEAPSGRDVARVLRAAQWRSEQELAQFVGSITQPTAPEIASCLAIVAHASSRAEPAAHTIESSGSTSP